MDDGLVIAPERDLRAAELLALYDAVGWTAYTATPHVLQAAVAGSSFVVTARRGGGLVGLARAVSDDEPGQRAFYESLGYTEIRDFAGGTLRSFVRFDTENPRSPIPS